MLGANPTRRDILLIFPQFEKPIITGQIVAKKTNGNGINPTPIAAPTAASPLGYG